MDITEQLTSGKIRNRKLKRIMREIDENFNKAVLVDNFLIYEDYLIIVATTIEAAQRKTNKALNLMAKQRFHSKHCNYIVYIGEDYEYKIEDYSNWLHSHLIETVVPHINRVYGNYRELYNIGSSWRNIEEVAKGSVIQINIDNMSKNECIKFGKIIKKKDIHCYIHACCSINICNEVLFQKRRQLLISNLKNGHLMGARGVIIHVGKHSTKTCELTKEEGVAMMHKLVKDMIKYASLQCPLVLETPAGQKSELLTRLNDFANFYKKHESEKFKLCVDSAHVFATGYLPEKYLRRLINKVGADNIVLIHLNDSKKPYNSRVDRHQAVGYGFIGMTELASFINYAAEMGIDMVEEW